MKKTHIAAIVMLLVAVVMLIRSTGNLSTFATFETAAKSEMRVKVVGQLSLADPVEYDPEKDPNHFSFYLIDEDEVKRKVILSEPKPRDFERAEQIVVSGKMNDNKEFVADEILLKCPSKYAEEQLELRKASL